MKSLMLSEVKLSLQKSKVKAVQIRKSADLEKNVRPFFSCINYQEEFKVIHLDQALNIVGIQSISSGGQTHCIVDPRIVFTGALLAGAVKIVLVHNHPSGNLKASPQDIDTTNRMVKAGKLLEVEVIDHIILTEDSFVSLFDQGLM